jgi:hypothetical protein
VGLTLRTIRLSYFPGSANKQLPTGRARCHNLQILSILYNAIQVKVCFPVHGAIFQVEIWLTFSINGFPVIRHKVKVIKIRDKQFQFLHFAEIGITDFADTPLVQILG